MHRLGLSVAVGMTWLISVQAAPAQDLISHPDLAPGSLTKTEAVLFFTRRLSTWKDGQQVTVFVLSDDDPLHRDFAKRILGLFPYQLRRTWDRQVFSGTGQAPVRVADQAEMIRRVAATPGAIGYAESPPDNVRVHQVRGD